MGVKKRSWENYDLFPENVQSIQMKIIKCRSFFANISQLRVVFNLRHNVLTVYDHSTAVRQGPDEKRTVGQ